MIKLNAKLKLSLHALKLTSLFILLLLFGCQKDKIEDEIGREGSTEVQISAEVVKSTIYSRATDTSFEDNDKIGVFIVKNSGEEILQNSGNYIDNRLFTFNSSENSWTTSSLIYYPENNAKIDIYSYYPYQNTIFEEENTIIKLQVKENQQSYSDYTASDFLVASKKGVVESNDKVNLVFNHKMAQAQFILEAGSNVSIGELLTAEIYIKNVLINATYNLGEANNSIPIKGTLRGDITPYGSWEVNVGNSNQVKGLKSILVPQELGEDSYIEIKLGTRVFIYEFSSGLELRSGYSRIFSLKLATEGVDLTTSINSWDYDEVIYGNALEQGKDKAFITEWEIPANTVITLPLREGVEHNFWVDWGDGSPEQKVISYDDPNATHTYTETNTYQIKIWGICEGWKGYSYDNPNIYLTKVIEWGDIKVKNYNYFFASCKALKEIPTYMPNSSSFYATFYNCTSLTSIPENLFKNCKDAINFGVTFNSCTSLTAIPEDLFKDCPNVISFYGTFWTCTSLTTIPEDLFSNCENAKNFDHTFAVCSSLVSIPEHLFKNCNKIESLNQTFYRCNSLTSLPEGLFQNCPNIESFWFTFTSCTSLTSIPENLFSNCINTKIMYGVFMDCTSLISIPENLFSNCINVEDFRSIFHGCSSLVSIPEILFSNCTSVEDFGGVFRECTSLLSIPENLFKNCINAKTYSSSFYGCASLNSIPENLFSNCLHVEDFGIIFSGCSSLTSIPENLFKGCPNVKYFNSTFSNCSSLISIPENLFSNCLTVESFSYAFSYCTNLRGITPTVNSLELWERAGKQGFPNEVKGRECFYGCTGLDNYNEIPADWK